MTLNLMLTSRDAVYLSADFRLISVENQTPLPDSYDTQKLIPVIRQEWSALVAYMGIASAPPLIADMGQWMGDQIETIPPAGDCSALSAQLLHLNRWLDKLRGDRRIAISAVGFRGRRPFLLLLSNFVDLDGHVTVAGPQLKAYLRTPNKPEVRAVGSARPDVFERVRLVRMLMANAARGAVPQLIRQTVAEVNANVARRSEGAISEECISGFLLRSGAVALGGHGIPEQAACFPRWLRRDLAQGGVVGFKPLRQNEGAHPMQWKGTTAKLVKGSILRSHEIANAGSPIFDGHDRRHHPPTWRATQDQGKTSVCISFSSPAT